MREKTARWLLIFAAAFNMINGMIVFSFPEIQYPLMFQTPPVSLEPLNVYARTLWLFVVIMGIGYGMVAMNPRKNHAVLWIGILGKVLFFLLNSLYCIKGTLTFLYLGVSSLDLGWAAIFLWIWSSLRQSNDS